MRSNTIICVYWKYTDRIEIFVNLGKLYNYYDLDQLGISRTSLNRKNLILGYENDIVRVNKFVVK